MTPQAGSYLKVAYDLRPAKQIERRMLIDVFQILAANGFPIRDYAYTGMGSIYFFDFILFRKLLGIRRMLSVESDTRIRKRVKFNRPFADVEVAMKRIGDVIPTLDRDLKHILWLDYDCHLDRTAVTDSADAAARLSPGSLLLVTVDIEPPVDRAGPAKWREFYEQEAGHFFGFGWGDAEFAQTALAGTNARILFNAIDSGVNPRPSVRFMPLFNFAYADSHRMLTIGGMVTTGVDERKLGACDFSRSPFLRTDREAAPYEINAPKFTRRERHVLDHNMPCEAGWAPKEFEITPQDLEAYRDVYRYYPAYAELLV